MKCLVLVMLAGCGVVSTAGPSPVAPDATPADDTGAFDPTWTMRSPAGMRQLPEEDVAVADGVVFSLRGFDQIAGASDADGAARLTLVPRRGERRPLRILSEPTETRSLIWMLTPIGLLWHNPIVWDDGKPEPSGRVLYHVLDGGLLNATWSDAAAEVSLDVELSAPPRAIGDARTAIYTVGTLRVRVVTGTVTVTGTTLAIAPVKGRIQTLVYRDPVFDTAAVDAAGALLEPLRGRVAELSGPVAGAHVRFTSPLLGIDRVLGIPAEPSTEIGPTLLADRAELHGGDASGWRISALAVKIIKTGPIGMRRMRYANGTSVGGQTFNFYVFSPRGTVTLWPVGRIVEPYRLSRYGDVMLADFPATSNDYSEDLVTGRDVMTTRAAWAWDGRTLVEAATLTTGVAITHTGQEGNSVDGGWRHTATGALASLAVGDAAAFAAMPIATGSYRFDAGDSLHAVYPEQSVFHHRRAWSGAWAERADRVASLRSASTIYFGAIKDLHQNEVLPANRSLTVSQVLHVDAPDADPAVLRARFAYGDTPLRDGMLDLDLGAAPIAPWDLAVSDGHVGIVFGGGQ